MFFVIITGLSLGFLLSLSLAPFWNIVSVALFAYMTFITSLETNVKEFIHVLAKPSINLWIIFLVHVVMPLIAFGAGWLFYPHDPYLRLGLLISALIPIGITSIIWTSIVGGDIALAFVAVILDTLAGPILLAATIALATSETIHLDYANMLTGLMLMVTIPSFLGMAVNGWTGGALTEFAKSGGGFSSKLALVLIIFINSSAISHEITWALPLLKLLLVILLLTITGYTLGWLGALLIPNCQRNTMVTMVYNVGMRNISFGSVLAITYFPAVVAVPITLAMFYQQPMAALAAYLLNKTKIADKPGK